MRSLALLLLFALLGFCALGLLATLELTGDSSPLPWRLGYGSGAVLALGLIVRLLRNKEAE